MVNLVFRFLFITLFLIFCPWVNAAKLTLKADQTLIPMGGRVEVQFVFEGLNNSPNLGSLDIEGFQIVGRSTSSSIQFINGKKSESATITLQLRPKQTGRLTIGPYEVNFNNKKLRSNQLVIVVDASNLSKGSKNSIFIEAELDKKKLVSGEQNLYKIKV
ncbi:BatD family protein, partial [bacterium]|nr:BatD family protein [bacterium]